MRRFLFTALAASAFFAAPAGAQGLFGGAESYGALTLHAGWRAEDAGRVAGLRLELAPGWKTYWRTPGDSGVPPHFDWTGSRNLAAVDIEWPAPMVFETYGAKTIGYEGRMVLPLRLTPEDPNLPIEVRLAFSYGLCAEICIPAQSDLAVTIAPDAPEDGAYFIRAARRSAPVSPAEAGVALIDCLVEGADKNRRFSASLQLGAAPQTMPTIVVEGPEGVWFGPVETRIAGATLVGEGPVQTEAGRWIDRGEMRLTLLADGGAVEFAGCQTAG